MIQIKSDQKMIFDIFLIKNNRDNVQKLYIEVFSEKASQSIPDCEIKKTSLFTGRSNLFIILVTLRGPGFT
jgi:hypothetical protein